jgi:microcystin-dependent protein
MATAYIGEIRMFGGNFAPVGWAFCNGQLIAINQNQALFSLIGTTYGGDGISTFALPDLRGRGPMHQGTSQFATHSLGELGGTELVALTPNQIPNHQHAMIATQAEASEGGPSGQLPARASKYVTGVGPDATLNAQTIQPQGGSQPHENMPPFLTVNFIISLQGVFPSQN